MTCEEIVALPVGREMDCICAAKVFGMHALGAWALDDPPESDDWFGLPAGVAAGKPIPVPHYSTSMEAAWLVVEKLAQGGWTCDLEWKGRGRQYEFTAEVTFTRNAVVMAHAVGATAPETICRAALTALLA